MLRGIGDFGFVVLFLVSASSFAGNTVPMFNWSWGPLGAQHATIDGQASCADGTKPDLKCGDGSKPTDSKTICIGHTEATSIKEEKEIGAAAKAFLGNWVKDHGYPIMIVSCQLVNGRCPSPIDCYTDEDKGVILKAEMNLFADDGTGASSTGGGGGSRHKSDSSGE